MGPHARDRGSAGDGISTRVGSVDEVRANPGSTAVVEQTQDRALAEVNMASALQVVLAVRSEGQAVDEWDDLMNESGEVTPLLIERLTIGVGGFFHRDAGGSKERAASSITGVVIMATTPRAYFVGDSDTESRAPVCSSVDGVTGDGVCGFVRRRQRRHAGGCGGDAEVAHPVLADRSRMTWDCSTCPLNQWGSSGNGRGKACKEMRRLLVLPDDSDAPVIVNLPPTSLTVWDKYAAARSNRADRAFYLVRTQLGTRSEKRGSFDWGVLTVANQGRIDFDLAQAIVQFQKAYRQHVQAMSVQTADYYGCAGGGATRPSILKGRSWTS